MTAPRPAGGWRGRPNSGPRRQRRSAAAKERFAVEGRVVWIERDRDLIHIELERASGAAATVGDVICLNIARARLLTSIADRDRDGRIDITDVALGDSVHAVGATPSSADGPLLRARRLTVSEHGRPGR